jgi:hypothetical protein
VTSDSNWRAGWIERKTDGRALVSPSPCTAAPNVRFSRAPGAYPTRVVVVDQAHEDISDVGAVFGLVEHWFFSVQDGLF